MTFTGVTSPSGRTTRTPPSLPTSYTLIVIPISGPGLVVRGECGQFDVRPRCHTLMMYVRSEQRIGRRTATRGHVAAMAGGVDE